MNLQKTMLSEKMPVPKGFMLYAAIYIVLWKSQKYRNEEWINSCQGFRWRWEQEGSECGNVRDSPGDGNILSLDCTEVSTSWL